MIKWRFPSFCPVMLLFDNINIHKRRSRHIRLKHSVIPVMWNFTVRAILKPNLHEIEHLWKDPATAEKEQCNMGKLQAKDFFIG